jgi:myo-inositol-1-phosphate synthase
VIDAIRLCRIARDRKEAGPLYPVSAYFMKHPPVQVSDSSAKEMIEDFIAGERRASEPVEVGGNGHSSNSGPR